MMAREHPRWSIIRRRARVDDRAHEVSMSYVAGYMLALEDLLKDLELLRLHEQGRNLRDAAYFEGHTRAWKDTRARVTQTLNEARNTWQTLDRMEPSRGRESPGTTQDPTSQADS